MMRLHLFPRPVVFSGWRLLPMPHTLLPVTVKAAVASRSGATALEFALIAPILLALIMGIVETGLVFAADILLKNATHTAARTGRTGFVEVDSTREATVITIIKRQADLLMDPAKLTISSKAYAAFEGVRTPEPFIDANGNGQRDDGENYTDVNGNGQYDLDRGKTGLGGASQVVLYTVSYPWTFITPMIGNLIAQDGVLTLTATAVVQNEPY